MVVGFAVDRQKYDNETLPAFEYDWITPAVFAQDADLVPDGIRISFWALHTEGDIELLCAAFARQLAVAV